MPNCHHDQGPGFNLWSEQSIGRLSNYHPSWISIVHQMRHSNGSSIYYLKYQSMLSSKRKAILDSTDTSSNIDASSSNILYIGLCTIHFCLILESYLNITCFCFLITNTCKANQHHAFGRLLGNLQNVIRMPTHDSCI